MGKEQVYRRGKAGVGRAHRLVLAIVVATTAAVTVAVSAVRPVAADPPVSAKASVTPNVQPFNDSVFGTVFAFSIRNTASTGTIGAIEIARASASQTIGECRTVPSGWTVERTDSRCRYRSGPGPDDDIAPGQVNNEIHLIANTTTGTQDALGTWSVKVSKKGSFEDLVSATAEPPGLTLTLHSFEVQSLVVDPSGDSAPGAPCPANDPKPLLPGSGGHAVAVCGWNGTRSTLTPSAARSSLSGSLFTVTGTFQSGPIGPIGSPAAPVVLARWTGAVASTVVGSEHSLTAEIGVDARRSSPVRSGFSYSVFNAPPAVVAAEASTAEGTSTVVDLVGTDPESQPLTFSIVSPPQHGSLAAIVPGACTSVPFFGGTCRATVRYTADPGFVGDDVFSYRVNDGVDDSPPAEVSVMVYHPSVPPVNGFAIRFGGPKEDTAKALAVDGDGNTIVAGHFEGTMDLDPGPGVRSVTVPLLTDLFLAKYSPSGQLLWGTSFGSSNFDSLADVAVDGAGNIAITGSTSEAIDFGGGPRPGGRFGGNSFIASFTPDGTHRWSFELGDAGPAGGLSVAFDQAGNLLAGGYFTGAVDFDPGPGVTSPTAASFLDDAFMAKLDSTGALVWARRIGAFSHESAAHRPRRLRRSPGPGSRSTVSREGAGDECVAVGGHRHVVAAADFIWVDVPWRATTGRREACCGPVRSAVPGSMVPPGSWSCPTADSGWPAWTRPARTSIPGPTSTTCPASASATCSSSSSTLWAASPEPPARRFPSCNPRSRCFGGVTWGCRVPLPGRDGEI